MGPISPFHILILAIVALIILGPSRLPQAGEALGKAIRNFRAAVDGHDDSAPESPAPTPGPAAGEPRAGPAQGPIVTPEEPAAEPAPEPIVTPEEPPAGPAPGAR